MNRDLRSSLTAVAIVASLGSAGACRTAVQTNEPDCPSQLRFHGATYTAFRLTDQHSRKVGLATPACSDKAIDDGHRVTVWALPGKSPAEVLVRRNVSGRFGVYVADSLSPDERDQVLRSLRATR